MEALEKFDQDQATVTNNAINPRTAQNPQLKSHHQPPIVPNTPTHPSYGNQANRPEIVRAARQFLTSPKVGQTPWEEQRHFLLEKGLTDAEIAEASEGLVLQQNAINSPPSVPPVPIGGFLGWANTAVVAGGASYVAYKVVREWILPKLFDIPADPAQERINLLQTQVSST